MFKIEGFFIAFRMGNWYDLERCRNFLNGFPEAIPEDNSIITDLLEGSRGL
jgi:hypothetical protein